MEFNCLLWKVKENDRMCSTLIVKLKLIIAGEEARTK